MHFIELKPKLHGYGIVPDTGTDTGIHHFLKNICGTQWILDIGYEYQVRYGYGYMG